MENEYVVINKTEILKRIEDCEEVIIELSLKNPTDYEKARDKVLIENRKELNLLKQILSQSTSLNSIIEDAFTAAKTPIYKKVQGYSGKKRIETFISVEDYIKKFNINFKNK
jgi:hypothetical protein